MQKSSHIHSYSFEYGQNLKRTSASSKLLPHFHCRDVDLSPSVEPAQCLQHSSRIFSDTLKNSFKSLIPQILQTSERGLRSNIAYITKIFQRCFRKNRKVNMFLQKKHF